MKGSTLFKLTRVLAAVGSLAVLGGTLALSAAPAGATSVGCGNQPHCFGLLSAQASPLEIDTSGPIHAGTPLVGHTPVFSSRGDWRVSRFGQAVKFRFAPNGVNSGLCITAVSDVARSRPRLEPCQNGTAGSSHQLWIPVNVIDHGFRVLKNGANGLVLTIVGSSSGSQVQIRAMGLGTGANKNFTRSKPF